ncbi:MAG: HU family DNA-binding protein [Pseudomonadota bacterium]
MKGLYPMNKKELIDAVAEDADIRKDQAGDAVESVFSHIEKSLSKGEEVRVPGFGTFKANYRPARTARNPQTGKDMKLADTAVAKFTPAKALKETVAGAKKHVKPK